MNRSVFIRSLSSVLGISAVSHAGGSATVYLKGGGRARGQVVTDEGGEVTILLADGTKKVIRRQDIETVDYGGPGPSPAALTPSPAPVALALAGLVMVSSHPSDETAILPKELYAPTTDGPGAIVGGRF